MAEIAAVGQVACAAQAVPRVGALLQVGALPQVEALLPVAVWAQAEGRPRLEAEAGAQALLQDYLAQAELPASPVAE